jgi:hypothetical protein
MISSDMELLLLLPILSPLQHPSAVTVCDLCRLIYSNTMTRFLVQVGFRCDAHVFGKSDSSQNA